MKKVLLGMTGLSVSPIAFGTWQLGGDWGQFDESAAIAAIKHARSLGVNFFDTAQAYGWGSSERLLGKALLDDLKQNRDEIVIATKGGLRIDERDGRVRDSSPEWLRRGVDESLTALNVDYIDLYQVHWPDPNVPFSETAQALEELVAEGKIRHVGVSNFGSTQMSEFALTRPVETVQPPYHLFSREVEKDVLPHASKHNIGVLIYAPLAHGLLTGSMDERTTFAADDWRNQSVLFKGDGFRQNLKKVTELAAFAREEINCSVAQLAVAWTLANPAVDVAIVGARSSKHIEQGIEAADIKLDQDHLLRIDRIMKNVVVQPGPSPEAR